MIPIIFLSFLPETTPNRHTKTSFITVTWDLPLWSGVVGHFSVLVWYDPSPASDLLAHLQFLETIPSEACRILALSPSFMYLQLISPATSFVLEYKQISFLGSRPFIFQLSLSNHVQSHNLKNCVEDSPSLVSRALMTPQLQTCLLDIFSAIKHSNSACLKLNSWCWPKTCSPFTFCPFTLE